MEIVTIYDEMDRPYLCECDGTRVIRVLQAPKLEDVRPSIPDWHVTETDVRFGE